MLTNKLQLIDRKIVYVVPFVMVMWRFQVLFFFLVDKYHIQQVFLESMTSTLRLVLVRKRVPFEIELIGNIKFFLLHHCIYYGIRKI